MAEADIDDIIATTDGDTTWGDDMRGAFTTLKQRRKPVSYQTGLYYDQKGVSGVAFTLNANNAGAAGRLELYPFYPEETFAIDELGFGVFSGVASAQAKALIYNSNTAGLPDTLGYATAALDVSTTSTFASEDMSATPFTFTGGKVYWLGVWHSSTAALVSGNAQTGGTTALGLAANISQLHVLGVRRVVTFGTAPDPWVYTSSEHFTNSNMVSVRFRIDA